MNNCKTQVTFTKNWQSQRTNQGVTLMEQQSHRDKHGGNIKETIQNDFRESLGQYDMQMYRANRAKKFN